MTQNTFAGELEANRFTVRKILDLARRAELRVPPFQRPLRWRRADHLLLLDSLYRGYPVGTLLLWRRRASPASVSFGEVHVFTPEERDALWIVDGQQRITSIVGCLLRPDSPEGRRGSEFNFWFDLDADRFLAATGERPGRAVIPVNRLSDPVATSRWAREVGADDALHAAAQAVGARLSAYEIPAYVTGASSDQVLRTIFARANTAGKQMRREEVFEALNKGLNPDASPQGLTERLRDEVLRMDFGAVENRDLQRALVCVAGFNPRVPIPDELREPGAATAWEERTIQAIRRTVGFLRAEAMIPHADAMPYVLPFILLPRFFHQYPEPGERTIELLVRWIWRGIAAQSLMATNQQFNPHYNALNAGTEEGVAIALLRLVPPRRPANLPESRLYNRRGMRTKLELAALFQRGPRALEDDRELVPVEVFEAEPTEQLSLFPGPSSAPSQAAPRVADLPRVPVAHAPHHRLVGARFLHPQVSGGDRAFASALQRAPERVLLSHGIDADHVDAARAGTWSTVILARTETVRREVDRLISLLARWGEDDDGPSMDALLAGADDVAEQA